MEGRFFYDVLCAFFVILMSNVSFTLILLIVPEQPFTHT